MKKISQVNDSKPVNKVVNNVESGQKIFSVDDFADVNVKPASLNNNDKEDNGVSGSVDTLTDDLDAVDAVELKV